MHWNLEPIERRDSHGAPRGTYRMVATAEGARSGTDCCDHDHTSPDEALLCGDAVRRSDEIVGLTSTKKAPADSFPVARTIAAHLGHVAMALLLAAVIGADGSGCSAARETPVDLSATLPARANCPPNAWRCNDRVPEMCGVSRDGVTRWYPTTQPARDGTPARCAVCVVDARAHCIDARLLDAGADASDASEAGP